MVSKKFLYLMFAISIICVFTGCTKKQTDNKSPSVTENAATKEKSNDSNKEKPVNLVWMTDSTWTDYLSESRKKAINDRIHELGYNYNLSFYGLNSDGISRILESLSSSLCACVVKRSSSLVRVKSLFLPAIC